MKPINNPAFSLQANLHIAAITPNKPLREKPKYGCWDPHVHQSTNYFQGGFYPLGSYLTSIHLPVPVLLMLSSALLSLRSAALAVWTSGAALLLKVEIEMWKAFLLTVIKLFAQKLQVRFV